LNEIKHTMNAGWHRFEARTLKPFDRFKIDLDEGLQSSFTSFVTSHQWRDKTCTLSSPGAKGNAWLEDGAIICEIRIESFPATLFEAKILEDVRKTLAVVAGPIDSAIDRGTQVVAGNSVFIVHGHDESNLHRLKELLQDQWKLAPIVLASEPGKGRSIVEKFEDEARKAVYALALLTPDDIVTAQSGEYYQARPNVTFELGWFYGRLGRDRVCILSARGTKIHSDLEGISRVEFTDSVIEAAAELERDLIAANVLRVGRGV
jgi:predicted nucleotide-binding protein